MRISRRWRRHLCVVIGRGSGGGGGGCRFSRVQVGPEAAFLSKISQVAQRGRNNCENQVYTEAKCLYVRKLPACIGNPCDHVTHVDQSESCVSEFCCVCAAALSGGAAAIVVAECESAVRHLSSFVNIGI